MCFAALLSALAARGCRVRHQCRQVAAELDHPRNLIIRGGPRSSAARIKGTRGLARPPHRGPFEGPARVGHNGAAGRQGGRQARKARRSQRSPALPSFPRPHSSQLLRLVTGKAAVTNKHSRHSLKSLTHSLRIILSFSHSLTHSLTQYFPISPSPSLRSPPPYRDGPPGSPPRCRAAYWAELEPTLRSCSIDVGSAASACQLQAAPSQFLVSLVLCM